MRILIADDEPLARERITRLLAQLPNCLALEQQACNGHEALALCQDLQPDILLLDIRMPGLDGMQVAKQLSRQPQPPAIIFCTAHDEFALEAFQVNAIGYLVKPVRLEQLAQALRQAQRLNNQQLAALGGNTDTGSMRSHISVKTHKGLELIAVENISYFMADQKYVTVFHNQGQTLIDEPLKALEQEFEPQFVRIHRSILINSRYIKRLQRSAPTQYELLLKGHPEALPVSRRHVARLKELMTRL